MLSPPNSGLTSLFKMEDKKKNLKYKTFKPLWRMISQLNISVIDFSSKAIKLLSFYQSYYGSPLHGELYVCCFVDLIISFRGIKRRICKNNVQNIFPGIFFRRGDQTQFQHCKGLFYL